jgi:uncharacterized protein
MHHLKIHRWLYKRGISRHKIRNTFIHRWSGNRILTKDLWSLHRGPVARAWLLGIMIACAPLLGTQVLITGFLCLFMRANIAIALLLQAIMNPLTSPLYYPFAYFVGCKLLNVPILFTEWEKLMHLSGWMDIIYQWKGVFFPLLWGCFVIGLFIGGIGYVVIYIKWQKHPSEL